MSYRVCIPTAGTGSRLGVLTKYVNKSLVSIANRPTLSHVIEQFPKDVEFVIALGHKGHLVREFLELAYPDRLFFFAEVSPFEGPGSGLGLSLLACKQYLQQPFVFISCDTLVLEPIPAPNTNWMAYAEGTDLHQYRTLKVQRGYVDAICEKGEVITDEHKPYIGLAGIFDFETFWAAMETEQLVAIETGEAHGLRALLGQKMTAHRFTWYDTGNPAALAHAREFFLESNAPNILEKENEAIWFVDNKVIKFSDDCKFIANRVKRASGLEGFIPSIIDSRNNMYSYLMVQGQVLSEVVTVPVFKELLNHSKYFWKKYSLNELESKKFHDTCNHFYQTKTLERINLFYEKFNCKDEAKYINGIAMPTLNTILDSLDWEWLSHGIPCRFHGDFHFENILFDTHEKSFVFLDWRQDFGGDLSIGDMYYDLAKLLHGLIISHELIAKNLFIVDWSSNEIRYDFHRKQILVECEKYFESWLEREGYDRKKVFILTALVYLNIAALHHHPYSLLLFSLGKSMLFKELNYEL